MQSTDGYLTAALSVREQEDNIKMNSREGGCEDMKIQSGLM
jgi:hypothetical protein